MRWEDNQGADRPDSAPEQIKTEDQNRVLQAVQSSLKEILTEEEQYRMADEYAIMSTWQMFQPLITAVSPEFVVEIAFDETTENSAK